MRQLAGILGLEDASLLTEVPVPALTEATNEILRAFTAARDEALAFFVDRTTTLRAQRIPVYGYALGQRLNRDGRPLQTRGRSDITVEFAWERFGWSLGWNNEDFEYMTVGDLEGVVDGIVAGNRMTHVIEINRAFWRNVSYETDDEFGSLTVRPLANGDTQAYPLANGSETTADFYQVSEYAPANISDTNNPFRDLRDVMRPFHASGSRYIAFINAAQRQQVLTGILNFVDRVQTGITPGSGEQTANAYGDINVPGEFLGIDGDSGVQVYEWDRVPPGYVLMRVMDAPAPLVRRVPEPVRLQGFKIESESEHDPFYSRILRERFGYNGGNRLSMAVMQLKASGTYDIPAFYPAL